MRWLDRLVVSVVALTVAAPVLEKLVSPLMLAASLGVLLYAVAKTVRHVTRD